MKLKKLAALIPLLYALPAAAIEPFIVQDIRVEGIQRTEAGTVFSYLPVKVGDTLNDAQAASAIRALFGTGFFKDVRLEVEQGVLVVLVSERPAIVSVEINGVKDFPKDQLRDNMKYAGLAIGRILDKSALEKAEQELKRQYVARGKYAVSVQTVVKELDNNRVAVTFNVVEGEVSKIRRINIVGNSAFDEGELLDKMKLSTTDWLSWLTKNDQYSKQKLSADLETLRSYYLDAGYLEFAIDSTQVSISPDKKDIFITINVNEGAKYKVSDVKIVAPEKVLPQAEMAALISVKPGDTFSRKELTESQRKIGERLGDEGYAFANVSANPDVDKEKHEVGFNFTADPGQRVYIRQVNVSGNEKTRDEVIRREFRQMEDAWFATSKIKKSKQKVDRLGFFSEVNIETAQVQSAPDQLDLNVNVKEKSTGSFTIGGGVNSGEGLVFTAGVSQANLFGSGNQISTQLNTSKINQVASVSYTNPYYTDEGVSRGFDIYKRNVDATRTTAVSQYRSSTKGAGMRFGVPINDDENTHYGLTFEKTTLGLTANSPQRYTNYVNTYGPSSASVLGTLGWSRDTRDSVIFTTQGTTQHLTLEVALPVASLRYYKLSYQHQWFYPIAENTTLLLNGEFGYGSGYGNRRDLPFFKNFYAGGTGSVRGYDAGALGPVDNRNLAMGGNRKVVGNAEVLIPMPGMGKDTSLRLSAFLDAGAIYGPLGQGVTAGAAGLRYSTGLALTWLSPAGPLKISYGLPLNKQPGDKLQKFQFTLGSMF
ncbi:MAG: outer membrane protein assembly factor BamA [Pseudomonadota bacterium]